MGKPTRIEMAPDVVLGVRRKLDVTQREMAMRLGVTEKTYRSWEKNGASRMGALMLSKM